MNNNQQITTAQLAKLNPEVDTIQTLEAAYDFVERLISNLIFAPSPSIFLENAGLSLSYPYQFIQCISGRIRQRTFGDTRFDKRKFEKLLLSLIIYCFHRVNLELDLKYLDPLEILHRFQRENYRVSFRMVI